MAINPPSKFAVPHHPSSRIENCYATCDIGLGPSLNTLSMKACWELATFYVGFLFQRAMTFDSPFADRSVDLYAFEPKVVGVGSSWGGSNILAHGAAVRYPTVFGILPNHVPRPQCLLPDENHLPMKTCPMRSLEYRGSSDFKRYSDKYAPNCTMY
ncbi:uncharacterized protein PAC_11280 [Phialocephala subalpina]|uniref:Uncharacterized protein n=1 Tax=Phialocephala subalpina TaxID=576137 RepID=A0A1L7X8N9_9HELO|nr:uncharacterized protein PAC_11280 [Phialocephala subalpina]